MKNLLFLFLLLSCFSCNILLDYQDGDYSSVLVINQLQEAGRPWRVYLSSSSGLSGPLAFHAPDGAHIQISDQVSIYSLQAQSDSVFTGNLPVSIPGKNYHIAANAPGYGTAEAEIHFPLRPEIIDITHEDTVGFLTDGRVKEGFGLTLRDPEPEKRNYYFVFFHSLDTVNKLDYSIFLNSDAPVIAFESALRKQNSLNPDRTIYYRLVFFTDEFWAGSTQELLFWDYLEDNGRDEPTYLEAVAAAIDSAGYAYFRSYDLYEQNDDLIFSEPAPLFSNITGGLGIATGFSADTLRKPW